MDLAKIVRGQVVEVDLDPVIGSEQAKTRPCVVVQNRILNQHSSNTIIVPVTDAEHVKKLYAATVLLPKGEGGLTKDSVALCNQVRTISKLRIRRVFRRISLDLMGKVDLALKIVLELDGPAGS